MAVEASANVDGVLTLPPPQHALILAAHAWAHAPLANLRDLLDVSVMAQGVDRSELEALASGWGIKRIWRTTVQAADTVLNGNVDQTWALRIWARNLRAVRERTVLEAHLENWLSPFWAHPLRKAFRVVGKQVVAELSPAAGETWEGKLQRSGRAIRNAAVRKSEHDRALGPEDSRRLPRRP